MQINESIEKLKDALVAMRQWINESGATVPNADRTVPTPQDILDGMANMNLPDLTLANARESDVAIGKKFYAGNDVLKVGTLDADYWENQYLRTIDSTASKGDFVIPSSVTVLAHHAFAYNDRLTGNVILHDDIVDMGQYAFYNCKYYEGQISFPPKITKIPMGTYYACQRNPSFVDIPDHITEIDSYAFYDCQRLSGVIVPETVTRIGAAAFYNDTNVKYIWLKQKTEFTISDTASLQGPKNVIFYFDLLPTYLVAKSTSRFTAKVRGWKYLETEDKLPTMDDYTVTWFPTVEDMMDETNGVVADGTATATQTGNWFCRVVAIPTEDTE